MGRQIKFTQAIADRICERIADRESLRSICRDEEMPAMSSVLSWLADDNKAAFRVKYALAREIQADGFVDEMVEIADDRADDRIEKKNAAGETTGWQENGEAISIFGPEQEISTYAGPDGLARLSTTSIGSISGNTIIISIPRSTVLPVGSIVRPSVTPDGVHPYGAVIDRVVGGIPQSEKLKFNP
ncbi:hypothetical protein HFO03_10810 [Rhizobium laguerreae]|nr:hypothetical protein [Rhizobium laguerreae]NKM35087.1 hypothetical protein [Rhizobium laguerreae]NKM39984.1 hypothetical protein [Rhizobium laguerreae]NKN06641.1 hypothetical protein [Rhizobium laguerreae]